MREQIFGFLADNWATVDSHTSLNAPIAILREARQLPDVNNLQKRFSFKLSSLGPNPNGQHTVAAKIKNQGGSANPANQYQGLQLSSSEALCVHFLDHQLF